MCASSTGELFNFISGLKGKIRQGLPGVEAQLLMSPSIRANSNGSGSLNGQSPQSAVLILFFPDDDNEVRLVLIKRQTYEGPHSGQVSFPGGKREEVDRSLEQTALREAFEEVGVNPEKVELIGRLTPLYIPVSNMMVQPVVGFTAETPDFHPNLQEVDHIITVPVGQLFDAKNKSVRVISVQNTPITAPYYNVNGEFVWGATAMILAELEVVLKRK